MREVTRSAGGGAGGAYRARPGVANDAGRGRIATQIIQEQRRIGAARIREEQRIERQRMAAETRIARARAQGIVRAERQAVAAAKREVAARAAARRQLVSSVGRSAMGAVGAIGRAGVGVLGLAGGFAAGNALNTEVQERKLASQLANQAGRPGLKGTLLAESRGVAGFSATESMSALGEFAEKTGDLDVGRGILRDLGALALATGADFGDLGATAGQAFNVIRDQIKDPKEQVKELNALMKVLAAQGEMGAVEIKDLARDFGKLGAATRSFEGGAPELLRTMGAFAQLAVARGGAESSADASTASTRLASDIVTNRKKFKKLGVNIQSETDPTKLRDPTEIMADVLEKTGGDITKTSGLFGMESAKIFKSLSPVFANAEKQQKGSGRAAVMAEVARFRGAKLDDANIQSRISSRLSDPDIQFKEAMKKFNAAVGQELLPVVTKLVAKLTEAMPEIANFTKSLGKAAMWLADNPVKGIGLAITGAVVKDIASAKLGEALSRALSSRTGLQVTAATIAVAGAAEMIVGTVNMMEDANKDFVKQRIEGINIQNKARAELASDGKLSAETREKLEELNRQQTSQIDQATKAKIPSFLEAIANEALGSGPGRKEAAQLMELKQQGSKVIEDRMATQGLLHLDDAAKKQAEAAAKLEAAGKAIDTAATKLSGSTPNRGNKPSPVK